MVKERRFTWFVRLESLQYVWRSRHDHVEQTSGYVSTGFEYLE